MRDWPKTRPIKTKKENGLHITGRYMHPGLRESILNTYVMIGVGLGLVATIATLNPIPGVVLGGLMWVVYSGFRDGMVKWSGKNVDVKLFKDRIELRNGFSYKKYSRAVPTELRIEPHHKGALETAKEISRGRRMKVRYRNAIEVVMQYGEKRVPLAEFESQDIEKAKAVLFRIQSAQKEIDEAESWETFKKWRQQAESEFGPAPNVS